MSTLRTEYEFVLPKGYLDQNGTLHKRGLMRLATARDELEPLRDPTISSADDPRLTILVLARVVRRLGTLELVTAHEIEGLFAADLAFLQDFYGVINFGSPADIEAMLEAQEELERAANRPPPGRRQRDGHPAGDQHQAKRPWYGRRDSGRGPGAYRKASRDRGGPDKREMMQYPTEALWQEIVYLAYHLHWPLDDLLDLEHADRARLVRGVAALNARAWEAVRAQ